MTPTSRHRRSPLCLLTAAGLCCGCLDGAGLEGRAGVDAGSGDAPVVDGGATDPNSPDAGGGGDGGAGALGGDGGAGLDRADAGGCTSHRGGLATLFALFALVALFNRRRLISR